MPPKQPSAPGSGVLRGFAVEVSLLHTDKHRTAFSGLESREDLIRATCLLMVTSKGLSLQPMDTAVGGQIPFLPLGVETGKSYTEQLESHHQRVGLQVSCAYNTFVHRWFRSVYSVFDRYCFYQFIDFSLVLGASLPYDTTITVSRN